MLDPSVVSFLDGHGGGFRAKFGRLPIVTLWLQRYYTHAREVAAMTKLALDPKLALQEAYLLHRFEQHNGQKPITRMELLDWLAKAGVTPDGPDFDDWCRRHSVDGPKG
jgi:hypothetical protein